jgi:hypothetical protein
VLKRPRSGGPKNFRSDKDLYWGMSREFGALFGWVNNFSGHSNSLARGWRPSAKLLAQLVGFHVVPAQQSGVSIGVEVELVGKFFARRVRCFSAAAAADTLEDRGLRNYYGSANWSR